MEESKVATELTASLDDIVHRRRNGYQTVYVLLVSWDEADDLKIAEEVQAVHNLFQESFGFVVSQYRIPSDDPRAGLQLTLTNLICKCADAKESLFVLYYAGHGDANPKERKAIWAAKGQLGPTLNWYEVQSCLSLFKGDVWMILDCCYALQAARERDPRTHELLAASGIFERTPPAGDYSFTSALISTMTEMLGEGIRMTVKGIYARMIRASNLGKLQVTPVRFIVLGEEESIEIKPSKTHQMEREMLDSRPLALLSLSISLSKGFDDPTMRRFQRWLRTYLPKDITSITVDKVLLKTEHIQSFLRQRADLRLQSAIANDLVTNNRAEAITLQPSVFDAVDLCGGRAAQSVQARAAIEDLQDWNDRVSQSLESNLLLNPEFASERSIENLHIDRVAQPLGLCDAAKLRLLNMKLEQDIGESDVCALPINLVKNIRSIEGQPICGEIKDEAVYIEFRDYSYPYEGKMFAVQRIKAISRLLSEVPKDMLHILPFVGYIDEPITKRFGLVFRTSLANSSLSSKQPPLSTLKSLYSDIRSASLNDRFGLAISLAKTLSNLHAVGWVHKGLLPENIIFLRNATGLGFDLSRPFVCGFGLSRRTDQPSDDTKVFRQAQQVYTHPKRWGTPQQLFSPIHDMYSLGVILLEVGCWRVASKFDKAKKEFKLVNNEEEVRTTLVEAAKTYLPHMTGEQYCQVVLTCLTDALDEEAKDGDPSRLHKAFSWKVLDALVKAKAGL